VRLAIAIGEDADHELLQKFIGHNEIKPLLVRNSGALVKYIKWVSTAVLKSVAAPASQVKSATPSASNIPIPTPPAPAANAGRPVGVSSHCAPSPALILVSTDGYANSFGSEADFRKVGSDLLDLLRNDGLDKVNANLDAWLEASRSGSGDDVTLGCLFRRDSVAPAPPTSRGQRLPGRALLGGGGQGEVYRALWAGKPSALKWYYRGTATPEQWQVLQTLVKKGPPSDRFL
jgi:hypothetical protein